MSTRCNIKVVDGRDELWFYRHSDGYPEGALPLLKTFMKAVAAGELRDNVGQSAGWLIVLGNEEYGHKLGKDWKVGSIEPTTCKHGDIEYLYTLDLKNKKIFVEKVAPDKLIQTIANFD